MSLFKKRAKYRLLPDENGTYTLEKWHGGVLSMYLSERAYVKTPEEADQLIKNLERETIYYRESK
jgi:hypothetical protein